jgi:hypothetical protein
VRRIGTRVLACVAVLMLTISVVGLAGVLAVILCKLAHCWCLRGCCFPGCFMPSCSIDQHDFPLALHFVLCS